MFTPARMQQVNILVLKDDSDAAVAAIAEAGVVHLADAGEVEDWAKDLSAERTSETLERLGALGKKLREIARGLGIAGLPRGVSSARRCMTLAGIEEAEKELAAIEAEVSGLILERDTKAQELEKLRTISSELKVFAPLGPLGAARYSFLELATGRVRRNNIALIEKSLASIPHVIMPLSIEGDAVTLAAVALKKDAPALDAALREAAFERMPPPPEAFEAAGDVQKKMSETLEGLRRALAEKDEEIAAARRRHRRSIEEMAERVNCASLLARARGHFRKTGHSCLISGWVPEAQVPLLSRAVREAAAGRCYFEARPPEEVAGVREGRVKVPVLFRNPFFARPFELLTATYGIPEYRTIDPTVFVAVTFLIMFGVMFGDIGEGLVLALAGALLFKKSRREQLRKIGALVFYCGFSSAIFGFLYGSCFGVERWFTPVWVRPMSNVLFFFKTAIYLGIAMVSMGIVCNIVNALRTRDWMGGIFDKAGLIAGVIYWGAVGLVINALTLNAQPVSRRTVFLVVGIPVLLLFLRAPVSKLTGATGALFPEGVVTYLAETVIEVVEIFLGFLANTLSFIRVAAFALAHAMLFLAVFSLADVVRGAPGGTLESAAIIVGGNVLILALEGIIVTIQAIRLEYYEFFGKFFRSGGTPYEPVRIQQ